jgi:energy-coupling factor transporter ATP-binding protein EcfA2
VGYVGLNSVSLALPDGRVLLDEITFRVGEGRKAALIGANGAGKTTLLRIISGALNPHSGAVSRAGGLGVMPRFVGRIRVGTTVGELLASMAPPAVRAAVQCVAAAERALMDDRWFAARSFDRYLIFTADGYVKEKPAYSAGAAGLGRPG